MQIITILLIIVSILTLLSGTAIFFGSSKAERPRSAWFFSATIFATIWAVAIALFLSATPAWEGRIDWLVNLTFITAIFIDIALLGFINWRQKYGKPLTVIFLILGVALSTVFLYDHTLLYSEIYLTNAGNSIAINVTPFYIIYIAFFCLLVPTVIISLIRHIFKTTSRRVKGADLVLLIGFMISGTTSLIFNLILPFWTWDLIWLGPIAISTTIIGFYYAVLRYRSLNLSSKWLKVLSYIVVITSSAVIYMAIFYVIFLAMFRGSTPSIEVVVLNFIMILIVLALTPAMSEINMFINSLISSQKIDVAYIIKKITKTGPRGLDNKELAEFLAEHMHFEYIGFLVDGQVYSSSPKTISSDGIKLVESLGNPERGVWQDLDESSMAWQELDLSAVAALRDANGKTFGQVMVGKPIGKAKFSHKELVQVEAIINLVAVIINSKRRVRK